MNNLEERLATIYGDAAKLQIDSSAAGTAVALFLPLSNRKSRMSVVRAYLVDDETLALKRLARLLRETGRVELVGSHTDPTKALAELQALPCDVVFADIEMPGLSGFEMLSKLASQPLVIFTTAYSQYALQAFELHSVDYLVKPIDPRHLDRALAKLERILNGAEIAATFGEALGTACRRAARQTRVPRPLAIAPGRPYRIRRSRPRHTLLRER